MTVPRFRDLSLRLKVTLVTTLVAGLALLLDCAAIVASTWWGFRETSVQDLATRADIVGNNCTAAITFDVKATAEEILKGLAADENLLAACVYGRDGAPFAKYRREGATIDVPSHVGTPSHRFEQGRLTLVRPIVLD